MSTSQTDVSVPTQTRAAESGDEHVETLIIGAGQAGLSAAYHLTRRNRPCLVVDAHDRVGDVWRKRFDSLKLFTPAQYDSLPGMPFPLPKWQFPTGQQMGDYLEAYAANFALPVRNGVSVDSLTKEGERYVATSGHRRFVADNVIVATGTWQSPITPEFASELDPRIRQMHSAVYRNPGQLQPGPVLCVGASHSGPDIAYEVVQEHPTVLAGRIHGEVPFRLESRRAKAIVPIMWFLANRVLTERTPIGRKLRPEIRNGGGPLIRVKKQDLLDAGVEYTDQRVVGVEGGKPVLADGRVLDVANVVWCTGFGKDTDWLQVPIGDDNWPTQKRGVVPDAPGLYFVGLPFLRGFYSMLIGGVHRDAEYVARHIAKRNPQASKARSTATV